MTELAVAYRKALIILLTLLALSFSPLNANARIMLPSANTPYAYEFFNTPGRIISFHLSALNQCVQQSWYPFHLVCFSSNAPRFAYAESWAAAWLRYYHSSHNPSEYSIDYIWLYAVNPQGKTGYTLFARIRLKLEFLTNKNLGNERKCDISEGNPINVSNGNKFLVQKDYESKTDMPLNFVRYYNSRGSSSYPWIKWSAYYFQEIDLIAPGTYPGIPPSGYSETAVVRRPNGQVHHFQLIDGVWQSEPDVIARLEKTTTGWLYSTEQDTVEEYNNQGKLISITDRRGLTQTLTYSNGLLSTVTGPFGRTLRFTYYANGLIEHLIDPDNKQYTYLYDDNFNLESVQYPDGSTLNYLYEKSGYINALTGIVDERGIRFATYDYDIYERGILSEHQGGAQKVQVLYNSDNTSTVTDSLGATRNYNFETSFGSLRTSEISGDPCSTCSSSSSITYDMNGFISSRIDWNNNVTSYVHNNRGLEISRTEASGTSEERTILTNWHSTYRLPIQITEPGKMTAFTYDSAGNVMTRTETDTTIIPNVSRTTTYTYNSIGQILSIDGPRTDANDITTFTYDVQGNRATVTNALNQVTQIPDYDAHGNPLTVIDPNGVTTELVYDVRQRLTSRTVAASTADESTTAFTYDNAGQLTRITRPDGSYLDYEYDAAQRLIAIEDNLGNRIEYTLDAAGNRTAENIYDPGSVLRKTQTAVYDQLGRLSQSIGANTQTVAYSYDANGNRTSVTDGNSNTTTHGFDGLNRLTQMIDPYNGGANPTSYAYDAQDNLTSVTDPTNLTTTYQYNGFGETIQETSPNSGTTTYAYDSAGNRISRTDARNITVTYSYDALNRLTGIDYPGTSEDISYSYDQTLNNNPGIGRLTQIQDESGVMSYIYDRRGNITQADQTITVNSQNIPFSTDYQYDLADNLTQIAYPSGRVVDYSRNSLGQIDQVSSTYNMQPQTLASAIGYLPFGSVASITYGNGLTRTLAHDQDYRVTDIVTPGLQDLSFSYDLNNNIIQLLNALNTSADQSFDYDALNRLINAEGIYGDHDYSYDGVGNRLSLTVDTTSTTNYSYFSNTHRLQSAGSQTRAYDNAGNTTQIDSDTYSYNNQNRLSQVTVNGQTIDYVYNTHGQRAIRQTATDTMIFIFDQSGLLIGEYDGTGNLIREYVYLNGEPLALAYQTAVHYYLNDHLGTPQLLMDQNQQVVWQAAYNPFGEANITTALVENNLRFPGQYFDSETEMHYNWFRYYDSSTGSYITSDPIGLNGGLNTYFYANANSLKFIDPYGLLGNCGMPGGSCVPPKPQDASVFGCVGLACLSSPINSNSESQVSQEMALGGGIEICDAKPEPKPCETEEPKKDCGIYDPNCDNLVNPPSVPVPTQIGYIVGLSVKSDGRICARVGVFLSLPFLPSVDLGGVSE